MVFSDEERKKIEEEEKIRIKIRLKYEQKSSGLAGVLSAVCPGLGQIYNGQFGKSTAIGSTILIGLILLSLGITFMIKGVPYKGEKTGLVKEEQIEMSEEGVIIEESKEKEEKSSERKPLSPYILTILGVVSICYGWSYGVKDAIRSAKKINEETLKEL